jgi:hypothetical protein
MTAWRNIEISPDDSEIIKIDKFEKTLGPMPANIQQIRELITRFEVCHFKYQQHLKHIKDSIRDLKPGIDSEKIGASHLRNGPDACKQDKTGRSLLGQKYVSDLRGWLEGKPNTLLGQKDPAKERLVRLLITRLLYDWKAYEELHKGGGNEELKLQVSSMDVCHYDFPKNMELLLQGIGQMKPVKGFGFCGSFNSGIKKYVEKEFSILNDSLKSVGQDNNARLRAWLTACLAKTLKTHVGLKKPLNKMPALFT